MRRSHVTTVSLLAAVALSACNSSNVLEPSAIAPQATQSTPAPQGNPASPAPAGTTATAAAPTPAPPPASKAPSPAQVAAVIAKTRLQIAPIVGASVAAATPLTERLQMRARERGITLAGSADKSATHVLKGYFSAITEGKNTTVLYVWDVYDPSGNRLHRINGQQKAPSVSGAEGWAAVSPATMQAIADSTVDQFSTWLGGRTG